MRVSPSSIKYEMKTSFIQVDNEMVLFMVVEELRSITGITIVCLILSGRPNFKEPTATSTRGRVFVRRLLLLESHTYVHTGLYRSTTRRRHNSHEVPLRREMREHHNKRGIAKIFRTELIRKMERATGRDRAKAKQGEIK